MPTSSKEWCVPNFGADKAKTETHTSTVKLLNINTNTTRQCNMKCTLGFYLLFFFLVPCLQHLSALLLRLLSFFFLSRFFSFRSLCGARKMREWKGYREREREKEARGRKAKEALLFLRLFPLRKQRTLSILVLLYFSFTPHFSVSVAGFNYIPRTAQERLCSAIPVPLSVCLSFTRSPPLSHTPRDNLVKRASSRT